MKNFLLVAGLILLIAATIFIFLEKFVIVAIIAGVFLMALLIIALLNFQYIRIMDENNRLIIRFYSVFAVSREYQSIEFPIGSLRNIEVQKYFFGLKWDVLFSVRLKQGIADYPPVCFSAVPMKDRKRLIDSLRKMILVR